MILLLRNSTKIITSNCQVNESFTHQSSRRGTLNSPPTRLVKRDSCFCTVSKGTKLSASYVKICGRKNQCFTRINLW